MSSTLIYPRAVSGRLALVAICALTLGACASQGPRPGTGTGSSDSVAAARLAPEDQVKQRALKRWGLLIERRFAEAYELLSPGYRQTMTQEDYVKTLKDRPVQWTRVSFKKATCEPELCSVEIQVDAEFEMPIMRAGNVAVLDFVAENWLLDNGEWYLVPKADL